MSNSRPVEIARVENGLGLKVEVAVSHVNELYRDRCVTIQLPAGGSLVLTPKDASRLGMVLQQIVELPFVRDGYEN